MSSLDSKRCSERITSCSASRGPKGLIEGKVFEITNEAVAQILNTAF